MRRGKRAAAKIKGGGKRRGRHRVSSPRSQKLISMEGWLKGGASREELYRARTKRTEKPRMKRRGEPKGERRAKGISEFSEVFKGTERQDGRCE